LFICFRNVIIDNVFAERTSQLTAFGLVAAFVRWASKIKTTVILELEATKTKMQPVLVYLISFASAVGGLTLWKLYHLVDASTRRIIFSFLRKRFIYTLVLRRRRSTSDVNVLVVLNILLVVAANVTACTVRVGSSAQLAKRCGTLFMVNVLPLYLGGRTSFLADRILRLPLTEYHLFHRWIGRICVLQGLVHGIINASTSSSSSIADTLVSFS
jgi:hypothetical protein